MKIFVTGGTGFVGNNFLNLASKENKIYAVTRRKNNNNIKNVEYLHGKLSNNWDTYLKKSDVLIHFASTGVKNQNQNLQHCIEFNVLESLKLFLNAYKNNLTKWIVIGTSSEYGMTLEKNKRVSVSDTLLPSTNYSISKKIFFETIFNTALSLDAKLIYFRLFPVYGYNEPVHRLIPQLIKHSRNRREMIINNSNVRIDYSDVIDVCKKILKSSKFKNTNFKYPQVWNLASGNVITIENFIKKYIKKNNINVKIKYNKSKNSAMHHISKINSIWN